MVAPSRPFGSFIPTSNIYDASEIKDLNIEENFKEILIRLYQNLNRMALLLNQKETGFYPLQPFVTSNMYFPNPGASPSSNSSIEYRSVYRQVVNFGALPNAGTKSVAHNIPVTGGYTFVHIYGGASDVTNKVYIPLPYASPTAANNIELNADATNVNITTGSNRSTFTVTYIVLEYLQF